MRGGATQLTQKTEAFCVDGCDILFQQQIRRSSGTRQASELNWRDGWHWVLLTLMVNNSSADSVCSWKLEPIHRSPISSGFNLSLCQHPESKLINAGLQRWSLTRYFWHRAMNIELRAVQLAGVQYIEQVIQHRPVRNYAGRPALI
jgi:hypothetical protein